MSGSGPAVLATYVSNLKPYFVSQGLNWDDMIAEVGISAQALADPDDYVDINAVATLMENAAETTGDSCFGLHCAEATPVGAVSFLGFIVMSAPTTKDALKALQRYLKIVITPIETSYRVVDGRAYLIRSYPPAFHVARQQFDLFALGLMIRRLRQGAGASWDVDQIELDHPDPGCPAECKRLLAPRILYNRSQCSIVVDINSLDRNLRNADPKLFDILKKHAEHLLDKQPASSDILDMTRHYIALSLPDGTPELDAIAASLKMSPRSLQARLAEKDTNFISLLGGVRSEKAHYYLTRTDLPITEVAYQLGFTDVSTFSRASSRWFKKTPSAYRNAERSSRSTG